MYDLEKPGLTATLLFNQIGEEFTWWEIFLPVPAHLIFMRRPVLILDFQLSKKVIQNKGEIRLNISDIINRTQFFYQNKDTKTSFQKK